MQIVILLALALLSFVFSTLGFTQIIQRAIAFKEQRQKKEFMHIAFWLILLAAYVYLLISLADATRTVSLISFGVGFLFSFNWGFSAAHASMAKTEMKKVISVSANEHTSTYKEAFEDFLHSASTKEAFTNEDIGAAQQYALAQYYKSIAAEVFIMTEAYSKRAARQLYRTFEHPHICGYEITLSNEKPYAPSGDLYAMSFFSFTDKKADISDCKELDALTMAHIARANAELGLHI